MTSRDSELGATLQPDGSTRFLVWAPKSERVDLHIVEPENRVVPMDRLERGYWSVTVESARVGTRYFYRHNRQHDWPDPASRSQPDGVHGSSEVIDPSSFEWTDDFWRTCALDDYVIYELHVGTFTEDGTFDAVIDQLDRLVALGVTAVELMPIAEFPGGRNWGYDGAYPFAAESTYGGPAGLAGLIKACHQRGLAVVLDVVYNHFGPEGAYLGAIGSYFTETYRTPWGAAINFDGPDSDEVRRFFIESALYWMRQLRIDAFRLDAVHAIFDQSAEPFLRQFTTELHRAAREIGRTVYLIAESDLNDPRIIQSPSIGGFGFDAQWSDDLHHALHARVTGESSGYYRDFGSVADLRRAFQHSYVYIGQYSEHRQRSHGAAPHSLSPSQFVVCSQNHDQVGNRAIGDRLTKKLNFEQLKLAAASVILSPFVPLLFMGEEYGETTPFQYFTSHGDHNLIEAVRRGRTEEFKSFGWTGEIPDPHASATFERSKLRSAQRDSQQGQTLEAFYRELIRLRRELPALKHPAFDRQEIDLNGNNGSVLVTRRWNRLGSALILLNFEISDQTIRIQGLDETWQLILDSSNVKWAGPREDVHAGTRVRSGNTLTLSPNSAFVLSLVPPETP